MMRDSEIGTQMVFLGDVLALAEDLLGGPVEELALQLPEALLGLPSHVPVVGFGSDRVEDAALLWRRIIRGRWFGADSRVIASACLRMVLDPEAELSWPDAVLREMERVGEAVEAVTMPEVDLDDWVGSWLARAEQQGKALRPSRHLRLA